METVVPDRPPSSPHRPAQALCLGLAAVTTLVVGVVSEPCVVHRSVLTTIRGIALTYTPMAPAVEADVLATPIPSPKVAVARQPVRLGRRLEGRSPRRIAIELGRLGGLYGP